jgi:hypothetical protein
MRSILIITGIILLANPAEGQMPVGSWSDHLNYNTAKSICVGMNEVYASTGSSIIIYNKEYSELKKLSHVNGLSETGISSIAWSEENSILIIAFTNTNIDLVSNNTVYNIPDIYNKYIPENKRINRIRTLGKSAYLASGFGIVVVDLIKKEIHDTWKPGNGIDETEVFDIAFGNDQVYAVTSKGVWYADPSNQGLSYFGNWNRINDLPAPGSRFNHAVFSGGRLYVNESDPSSSGDAVYVIENGSTFFTGSPGVFNNSFDITPEGFTISSPGFINYYDNSGNLIKTISSYGWGVTNIAQGIPDDDNIWIADINYGLIKGVTMTQFLPLNMPGPAGNNVTGIVSATGKTIICGGGTDNTWIRLGRPFQVSVHENNSFNNIISGTEYDAMRAVIDPDNSNHFFISSWGNGLLEYENNILMNHYNELNSPLQTDIPGTNNVKICGLAMDQSKNLWITNTCVAGNIKILKPDGTWIVNPITIDAPVAGDIIITTKGQKWIVLPGGYGLFVLDDNNTPEISGDDNYKRFSVKDTENKIFSSVFSVAEDLDGTIWVGTDHGPLIYYDQESIFDDDARAFRIKIPRNDGTGLADYMLGTETITSIAIDGGNRKWLGTSGSGAYLLSPDGTKQIRNYKKENSPILSDSIITVALDNTSGEIWFGTSEGVVSVRGEATAGASEFVNVYSFPNPVREDFKGNVTITGLMRDSHIKITDISGNLVYETTSEGGQASWDLTTYNGRRVTTGVYLVFCASSDGTQAIVTKMLVIR